uniref:Uncharacterized protein n=1 Tax=Salix viminalis TaxID=40686 RepID=A0A6N2KZ00_SALVM
MFLGLSFSSLKILNYMLKLKPAKFFVSLGSSMKLKLLTQSSFTCEHVSVEYSSKTNLSSNKQLLSVTFLSCEVLEQVFVRSPRESFGAV